MTSTEFIIPRLDDNQSTYAGHLSFDCCCCFSRTGESLSSPSIHSSDDFLFYSFFSLVHNWHRKMGPNPKWVAELTLMRQMNKNPRRCLFAFDFLSDHEKGLWWRTLHSSSNWRASPSSCWCGRNLQCGSHPTPISNFQVVSRLTGC